GHLKMYVILFIVWVLFYKPCKYKTTIVMIEDVAVQVGDDVTFHCFHPKDQLNRVMWFKQTLGERPVLVASSYHWTQKSVLYDDFEKSKRFRVGAGIGSFNLTIQKTAQSDSAAYYCAVSFSNVVYFGAGTNLVIRGSKSNRIHILQQPTSSGGNVTLLCTIQNEQDSCGGDHKVYWFKHGLGKSHSGIIYTQGSCKNSSMAVSPTKSCLYSLSLRNIKPSDAGTYYCAVVTCTDILFGHGINLTSDGKHIKIFILIGLAALLTISFFSNILLCVKKMKGNSSL
uniref:Ig-like domain-containing protein n=1 Tax=Sinocyclocheilus grahami TaxID=75366 RepID=A0A672QYM9_SINGR